MRVLEPQMDETSRQLDQPLVIGIVGGIPPILQPEMFQHIVGLVVAAGVEAFKIAEIAGLKLSDIGNSERPHECLDAIGFFQDETRMMLE
jgi:hypothetical protein